MHRTRRTKIIRVVQAWECGKAWPGCLRGLVCGRLGADPRASPRWGDNNGLDQPRTNMTATIHRVRRDSSSGFTYTGGSGRSGQSARQGRTLPSCPHTNSTLGKSRRSEVQEVRWGTRPRGLAQNSPSVHPQQGQQVPICPPCPPCAQSHTPIPPATTHLTFRLAGHNFHRTNGTNQSPEKLRDLSPAARGAQSPAHWPQCKALSSK